MPAFPDGLEIDYSKPLNGTMAPYAEQLLVCTGQVDWPSKVEDDHGGENLMADVKELIGRGGDYADVSPSQYCLSIIILPHFLVANVPCKYAVLQAVPGRHK